MPELAFRNPPKGLRITTLKVYRLPVGPGALSEAVAPTIVVIRLFTRLSPYPSARYFHAKPDAFTEFG